MADVMVSELRALIEQRKALDKRIRELKRTLTIIGCVKYDFVHLPRGDEHTISIMRDTEEPQRNRYYSLIEKRDKGAAIESLEKMINDLISLKTKLGGDANE